MKEIEVLLQRYAKGELTEDEQARLNQLTRRDEVLAAAGARAHQIRRTRRTRVSVLASLVLVAAAGTALFMRPAPDAQSDCPAVARTDARQEAQQEVLETVPASAAETVSATVRPAVRQQEAVRPATGRAAAVQSAQPASPVEQAASEPLFEETEVSVHAEADAVVACNTHCTPDSVISDIWKFLKA